MSSFWFGALCFLGGVVFTVITYAAVCIYHVLRNGKAAEELADDDDLRVIGPPRSDQW